MIILHSEHDKTSRDFIEKYGEGHEILNYENSISNYSGICGFPSVVVNIPAYYKEREIIEDEDTGEEIVFDGQNIEEHIEIIFNPSNIQDMIDLQNQYNNLATISPVRK